MSDSSDLSIDVRRNRLFGVVNRGDTLPPNVYVHDWINQHVPEALQQPDRLSASPSKQLLGLAAKHSGGVIIPTPPVHLLAIVVDRFPQLLTGRAYKLLGYIGKLPGVHGAPRADEPYFMMLPPVEWRGGRDESPAVPPQYARHFAIPTVTERVWAMLLEIFLNRIPSRKENAEWLPHTATASSLPNGPHLIVGWVKGERIDAYRADHHSSHQIGLALKAQSP